MPVKLSIALAAVLLSGLTMSCGNRAGAKSEKAESSEPLNGGELFMKYICMTCHSFDGREMYGPGLDSIYMTTVRVKRGGEYIELLADREYLKRSILAPNHERLEAYESREMPVPDMTEEEAEVLVDHIISFSPQ